MWWPVLGGLVVGLGGMVEPKALGVGYGLIADLLRGDYVAQGAARADRRQGADLVDRAGLGDVGGGGGTALDDGMRLGALEATPCRGAIAPCGPW